MNRLTNDIREESPWTMMFADESVLYENNNVDVETKPENWRVALEKRGVKISWKKNEFLGINKIEDGDGVQLKSEAQTKIKEF